jgi:hypothetical protein
VSAYDNSGSVEGVNVSTVNFSFTTSGTDRALVGNVHIVDDPTAASVSAITYNGVSLGAARNDVTNASYVRTQQFVLANPAVGANTLSVTLTATATYHLVLGAVSATAVDQTTPVRVGSPATAQADSASPTVNINSAVGDLVVDAITVTQSSGTGVAPAAGAGQTGRYTQIAAYSGVGGSTEPGGAPTVTMSWTTTGIGSPEWAIAGLSLQDVGGAAATIYTRTPLSSPIFNSRVIQ